VKAKGEIKNFSTFSELFSKNGQAVLNSGNAFGVDGITYDIVEEQSVSFEKRKQSHRNGFVECELRPTGSQPKQKQKST
jgi:hypothetical protein